MDDSTLTFGALKQVVDSATNAGKVLDLGVPIHRTNATPLDLSSIILLDGYYQDEASFRIEARKAIEEDAIKNGKHKTWYPGQQLNVIGRIGDKSSSTGHVLSFILQPKNHLHTDFSIANDETSTTVNETNHETIAQELVYKPYIDSLKADLGSFETNLQKLRSEIGELTSIMNFIGIFEEIPNSNTHPNYQPKPGDIIIVQKSDETEKNGSTTQPNPSKKGMEYIYTSEGYWEELGFWSNIVEFIGGTSGLKLPEKLFNIDVTSKSLISFIQYADESLAEKIGILKPIEPDDATGTLGSRALFIPIEIFGKYKHGLTLLEYLQESDQALAKFIRGEDTKNELNLPKDLLNSDVKDPSNLLEFIQAADAQLDRKIEEEFKDFLDNSYVTIQEDTNTNYSILKFTKRGAQYN